LSRIAYWFVGDAFEQVPVVALTTSDAGQESKQVFDGGEDVDVLSRSLVGSSGSIHWVPERDEQQLRSVDAGRQRSLHLGGRT
jgi:hypothetical protein